MPAYRLLVLVLAVAALLASATSALAARPPIPAGAQQLSPGQLPTLCVPGAPGAGSYGPTLGYYFDTEVDQWVNAPWCYPRWGSLVMSASQVTNAGSAVTFTAIPSDGSNSAEFAPDTKSISWDAAGAKIVAGCGASDLSCTIIPAAKATETWQWAMVHVAMPRHFLIDSPGSNCAGVHLCGGVTTNAWAYAGVRPERSTPAVIHGRVVDDEEEPMPGVKVAATGPSSKSAVTDAGGRYELSLRREGSYKVRASNGAGAFGPSPASVRARRGSPTTQNFTLRGCSAKKARAAKAHSFRFTSGAAGGLSWDECSGDIKLTWSRTTTCEQPVTFSASWGAEQKRPLKTFRDSNSRYLFATNPPFYARIAKVTGPVSYPTPTIKLTHGTIWARRATLTVAVIYASGLPTCVGSGITQGYFDETLVQEDD